MNIADTNGETVLSTAAASLYSEKLITILLENGAEIDHQDAQGYSPLMNAIRKEQENEERKSY